jgi:hypothetical protein
LSGVSGVRHAWPETARYRVREDGLDGNVIRVFQDRN